LANSCQKFTIYCLGALLADLITANKMTESDIPDLGQIPEGSQADQERRSFYFHRFSFTLKLLLPLLCSQTDGSAAVSLPSLDGFFANRALHRSSMDMTSANVLGRRRLLLTSARPVRI
jgi:hypothetical protein